MNWLELGFDLLDARPAGLSSPLTHTGSADRNAFTSPPLSITPASFSS
jgi:hypothetical protein